jgi:hypothetical protein
LWLKSGEREDLEKQTSKFNNNAKQAAPKPNIV